VRRLSRRQEGIGLSETELRERLNRLQELHILPEHRVQPGVNPEGGEETG
jgi:DNA-binding Lrp family transcriptional regulator